MIEFTTFDSMQIQLASPDTIREWSYGEVKKSETINYRTLKPERDGLFCEKIFGPTKDWECGCGKYKRQRYKNIICDRCGVKVTTSKVRRERMGHIELVSPVSHIWYFKGIPSRMGLLLDISPRVLERVLYFAAYIVTDPGKSNFKKYDWITEQQYRETQEKYGDDFKAGMGAETIKLLLSELDLDVLAEELKAELAVAQGQKKSKLVKRYEVVEAFRASGNRPEWMIMDVVPVIPPELRPMVQLDGGRFATSDLNDLYRRVINRNNRLKRLLELGSPDIIIRNEKRMLQEAVDALIDNGRRGRPVLGAGNRPLKSLSDMLKGKQGRFRQNLLGKRVDYSGRSVIVVGPELKIYQCGLPREMAIELFKPFVMNRLVCQSKAHNIKSAKRMVERANPEVWDVLEEVIKEHPVMLNRAPTLHRLGIQAFEPILVDGRAIKLHPLVCTAFNADFDGDQMAVHVPLSPEAQAEARFLMLSANNLLKPQDGKPVTVPSQDMVLGSYYLSLVDENEKGGPYYVKPAVFDENGELIEEEKAFVKRGADGEPTNGDDYRYFEMAAYADENGKLQKERFKEDFESTEKLPDADFSGMRYNSYYSETEAMSAYDQGIVGIHAPIKVRVSRTMTENAYDAAGNLVYEAGKTYEKSIITTIGRLIFNQNIPQDLGCVDRSNADTAFDLEVAEIVGKKQLGKLIDRCIRIHGITKTAVLLDAIKAMSYKFSTRAAISISVSDMVVPKVKQTYLAEAEKNVERILNSYRMGELSEQERYEAVIKTWEMTNDKVTGALMGNLDRFNPIYMMADSGARGSKNQIRQLAGMRGLMANTSGKTIEIPIRANFREGLNVLEYFISTHGARKGLADTALRTAESGYLTRRLVDVSQHTIVREDDCGTSDGIILSEIRDGNEVIEKFYDRLDGRFLADDVLSPADNTVLVPRNTLISADIANLIIDSGVKEVKVRSVLTCRARVGICRYCYGRNLATGSLVDVGEAVGIIAAQSIGEPGTQLTMRTFHTGGVASNDITQGLPRVEELFEARKPKALATITEIDGVVSINEFKKNNREISREVTVRNDETGEQHTYAIRYGVSLRVHEGDFIEAGAPLTDGPINPNDLLKVKGGTAVQQYIVQEIQRVYRQQGVEIADKHIEVIVRQMMCKVLVEDPGDSDFMTGTMVDRLRATIESERLEAEGKAVPVFRDVLLGITKAALATDSWLSAASFQETTRVLTDAAIKGKVDNLVGLKENVIIGKLIPAGTGTNVYRDIETEYQFQQSDMYGLFEGMKTEEDSEDTSEE